jgi:MFS family permease
MGFSLGVMQTALFLGNSLGPLLGGVVADAVGFRHSFLVAGTILLISGFIVAAFVQEEIKPVAGASNGKPFWRDLGSALTIPALPAMIGAYFAVQFGTSIVFPILPQFVQMLQGPAGHAASVTGLILAGAGVAGAISSVTAGFFSDRVGFKSVLIVSSLAAALLSVPQYFVSTTWQLFALRVLTGLAIGAMLPAASALTANLVPANRRGTAYGLTGSASSLGFAAGPLTAAAVVGLGGIRPVFLTAGVLLLGIAVWVAAMVHVPTEGSLEPEHEEEIQTVIESRPARALGGVGRRTRD